MFLFISFNLLYKSSSFATSWIVILLYISLIDGSTLLFCINDSLVSKVDVAIDCVKGRGVSKSNLISSISSTGSLSSFSAKELKISSLKAEWTESNTLLYITLSSLILI